MKKIFNKKKVLFVLLFLIIYFLLLFILRFDSLKSFNINTSKNNDNNVVYHFEEIEWIKILDLKWWTPYSRGYYHWSKLKSEIIELTDYYKDNLLWNDKYFWRPIYSLLNYKAKKFVEHIPEEYIEEIKWIADWSWLSFNDILLINVYDDLINLAWCSSMIIPKQEWFNDSFVHSRNLDYNLSILAKNKILLKYNTHISVWFPWYIWVLTWIWEKWISLSSHTSYTDEQSKNWFPTWLLYRNIIEKSSNMEEVKNILENSDRTIANNIIIWSYRENLWIVAEVTASRFWYRSIEKDKKAIISTNYFLSTKMREDDKKFWIDRYLQYFDKLAQIDFINFEEIKKIVSYYDSNVAWWWTIANRWTIQSIIMFPELRKLYIANWKNAPVTQWEFIEINY